MSQLNLVKKPGLDWNGKIELVPAPPYPMQWGGISPLLGNILKLYDSGMTVRGRRIFIESQDNEPFESRALESFRRAFEKTQKHLTG